VTVTPLDSAAHVLVADVAVPVLADADAHHLVRVLRLRPGATVTVCDGAGAWRACRLTADGRLDLDGAVVTDHRPDEITVAFTPVKGDRPEWTVQKLTEIGVTTIIPMTTERGIVHWKGERSVGHVERLRAVARAALGQCRRTWMPTLAPLTAFTTVLAEHPDAALADLAGTAIPLTQRTILIGPEGGWSERERRSARTIVTLGDHVLRAETAALVAATTLVALRSSSRSPDRREHGQHRHHPT
jgi:16S rRNA (uracil1498-N3)-methyltransferase